MASLSELGRFVRITAAGGLLVGALVDCSPTSAPIPTPVTRTTTAADSSEDLNRIIPTPSGEFLPTLGEKDMRITNAPGISIETPISLNPFGRPFLQGLYTSLQKESGTRAQRINAIRDNLSIILGSEGNNGTALKVDEGGVFLTVGHTLTRNVDGATPVTTFTESVQLRTGEEAPIDKMQLNLGYDIALFEAANGNLRKPVDNIQFNPEPLQPGTQVWLMAINQPQGSKRFDLHMDTASITSIPAGVPEYLSRFVFAKGIRGIPGTSGGPIIDQEGKIVGVIKGTVQDPDTKQQYSLIVPISRVQTLIDQSTLYTLPTKTTH